MIFKEWLNITKLLQNLVHYFPPTPPSSCGVGSHCSAGSAFPKSLYPRTMGKQREPESQEVVQVRDIKFVTYTVKCMRHVANAQHSRVNHTHNPHGSRIHADWSRIKLSNLLFSMPSITERVLSSSL